MGRSNRNNYQSILLNKYTYEENNFRQAVGIGALAIASMLGGVQVSQPLVAQTTQTTKIIPANKRKMNVKTK
ncbi:MAG: hypothetical protein ABWZ79_10705 [Pedobacter agri]